MTMTMTIDEITKKIIEERENNIAKAFTMNITSLLRNNGIIPIITEYTFNDLNTIIDNDKYKIACKYGLCFEKLDTTEHDKEIYNKSIDDFQEWLKTQIVGVDNKTKEILVVVDDRWELATDIFKRKGE